jgi:hypothetical protein
MMKRLVNRLLSDPIPSRYLVLRYLDRRLDLLSYADKLRWNMIERPHYKQASLLLGDPASEAVRRRLALPDDPEL